ncbi:hypothetical protein [Fructilactobacillus sanfranciscensis]|uniref:Uncharacterized protein n=2 Tax=Fructilactobacillus sanfranciscensis TaxID=1625 RepID=A0A5C4TJJ4_FRUSA|nr:hypothetical protein [Fructilactobacillus sanfranciscensis]MCG7196245.1 hypothetical protein [Fructilactobacillus sanfranciscensis]TNK90112.1 hypothetical protein DID87_05365 [Fructilactobacillus sanfranciscensis]
MKKIEDFLELSEEQAINYNFASDGEEADRSALAKEVYGKLFSFYDNDKFYKQTFEWFNTEKKGYEDLTGDTLITWRIPIMKRYYNQAYKSLKDDKKNQIKDILKKYAPFDGPVEFAENADKEKMQLSNYYVLGNLGLTPTWGGINSKRALCFNDCYDAFLRLLKNFYQQNGNEYINDCIVGQAILEQKDYFESYKDISNVTNNDKVTDDNNAFNNFINVNLLQDFTDGYDENNTYNVKNLASSETFEEYVKESAKVINARSKRMWKELQTK